MTQTVKMNELFSPAGLASPVLYVKTLLTIYILTWNCHYDSLRHTSIICLGFDFLSLQLYHREAAAESRLDGETEQCRKPTG